MLSSHTGSDEDIDPSQPLSRLSLEHAATPVKVGADTTLGGFSLGPGSSIDRIQALQEFLVLERAYATGISLLKGIYLPLSQNTPPTFEPNTTLDQGSVGDPGGSPDPGELPMDQGASEVIFANIEELSALEEIFVKRLEVPIAMALQSEGAEKEFAQVFLEVMPLIGLTYKAYISHLPVALSRYQSLRPSAALSAYLDTGRRLASPHAYPCDISSLLIKPAQRLLSYPQFLTDLYDLTPDNHNAKVALGRARDKMKDVASQLEGEARPLASQNERQSFQSLLAPTTRTTQRMRASRGADSLFSMDAASIMWNDLDEDASSTLVDTESQKPASIFSQSTSMTLSPDKKFNAITHELMQTERQYVRDLEAMHEYSTNLGNDEILDRDTIHYLFPNLGNVLKFQYEFLALLESSYSRPLEEQHWGQAFVTNVDEFGVYEPYCAYYPNAVELLRTETPHLLQFKTPNLIETKLSFLLLKPVQRVTYYLTILQVLAKHAATVDYPHLDELNEGITAVKGILSKIDQAQRRVENEKKVKVLKQRVTDWKGHIVANFGSLLLDDVLTLTKSEVDREYHVFLFEKILICCKGPAPHRPARKTGGLTSIFKRTPGFSNRAPTATAAPPVAGANTTPLELKGRIFIKNMVYVSVQAPSKKDDYGLELAWRGDDDTEYFIIRYRSEERLKEWERTFRTLLEGYRNKRQEERTWGRIWAPNQPQSSSFPTTSAPLQPAPVPIAAVDTWSSKPDLGELALFPNDRVTLRSGVTSHAAPDIRLPQPITKWEGPSSVVTPRRQLAGSSSSPDQNSSRPDKIKLQYKNSLFFLRIDRPISFSQLLDKVKEKIQLADATADLGSLRLQYIDEDGDKITLASDDDLNVAFISPGVTFIATFPPPPKLKIKSSPGRI